MDQSPGPSRRRIVPDLGPAPLRPSGWGRSLRAARRIALVLAWTALACSLQAVLIRLPGQAKRRFARLHWHMVCRILDLRVCLTGQRATEARPVLFVANHSSWLDIAVLGSQLQACFVSKDDVARWPVIGTVARLGRSVFVSRNRTATGRERADMLGRLRGGDDLILFPEGTSSDGARVLPFRSAFFALGEDADPPLVQPVSVVYDRLAGLPVLRGNRALLGWYGGMDLAPHVWALAGWTGLRAQVLLHPPLDPRIHESRKVLARLAGEQVAHSAAALRGGRSAHATTH